MRRLAACCLAASLIAAPAMAQGPPAPPTGPYGMPMQEWQGVSCLWGGLLAGIGVLHYSDVLGGITSPLLMAPLIATGFIAGCSTGANAAPGLVWLYRKL